MRRPRVAPVAVLLTVAAALAGCGEDEAGTLEDDAVLAAPGAEIEGPASSFVVPTGTVTVTVGAAVDRVPQGADVEGGASRAPERGSLLPVRLDFEGPAGAPWAGRLAVDPQEATVTVTVDGEEREVGSPYTVAGRGIGASGPLDYYLAVPGEPEAGAVEITVAYDGRTQSAAAGGDPEGPAAGLASLGSEQPPGAQCPSDAWDVDDQPLSVECDLPLVARTPYWPGAGWAPEGSTWLVAVVERVQAYPEQGSDVQVRELEGTGDAAGLTHGARGADALEGTVVVDAAGLDGVLPLTFTADLDTARGAREEADLRFEVPLPD